MDIITDIKSLFRARKKISYPGAVSHIIQRAGGKEPLFLEEADYLYMLHLLKNKSIEFNFDVFCFCLMPNHMHMLIKQNDNNLSVAMKNIFESYGVYFNTRYKRKGHVFCGAFRQSLCLDDTYLLVVSVYIHLNAYRAGLVSKPWAWRWSSCGLYIYPTAVKTFLNYRFILDLINKDRKQSCSTYKDLLCKIAKTEIKDILEQPLSLLNFRNKVLKFISYVFYKDKESVVYKKLLDDKRIEDEIYRLKMQGRLRRPEDIKARKFLIEQLKSRGFSIIDIAHRLSLSRKSIYKTLRYK